MANEVTTNETFEERMFQKIRADIGSLMTDEELKKLVESATERTFFQEEKRPNPNYRGYGEYDRFVVYPPVIQQIAKELLKERISAAIDKWLEAHSADIDKIFKDTLDDGLLAAVTGIIERRMQMPLTNLTAALEQIIFANNLKRSS